MRHYQCGQFPGLSLVRPRWQGPLIGQRKWSSNIESSYQQQHNNQPNPDFGMRQEMYTPSTRHLRRMKIHDEDIHNFLVFWLFPVLILPTTAQWLSHLVAPLSCSRPLRAEERAGVDRAEQSGHTRDHHKPAFTLSRLPWHQLGICREHSRYRTYGGFYGLSGYFLHCDNI